MRELVEVIAKNLVDNPDEVVVTEEGNGRNITIKLHVAQSDMGKCTDCVFSGGLWIVYILHHSSPPNR